MKVNRGRRSDALVDVPLALNRVAKELSEVVEMINDVEEAVGLSLTCLLETESQIRDLQKLDYMKQKVSGVVEFIIALSGQARKEWQVDARQAAKLVRLGDLSSRLSGSAIVEIEARSTDCYELFD